MIENCPDVENFILMGADVIDYQPNDGYWCYKFKDDRGVELFFSFDIFEGSVQVLIQLHNHTISIISHEDVVGIFLKGDKIISSDIAVQGQQIKMEVAIYPSIEVEYSAITI